MKMTDIAPSSLRKLRNVVAAFNPKNWEWSDILKRLVFVEAVLESFPKFNFESPEKHLLCKFTAQCLYNELPPGIHYTILLIYESICY